MPPNHARGQVLAADGLVASAHPAVSLAGASVLQCGGTAIDAALAMAAMGFVVLPGQCGVGGDAFAVCYDARRRVYTSVAGSGVGPDGADPAFFSARGLTAVPLTGPLAVAVPGAVACLAALHQVGATRPLEELWWPAIQAADRGVAVGARTVAELVARHGALAADDAAAQVFLPGGRLPVPGERLAQPALATTLRRLAADPADIYPGELAERCLRTLRAGGAPFSGAEWAATRAVVEPAISAAYRGRTIYTGTPPSPGYMLLAQAGVLDPVLGELPWLGAEAVHWLAEAAARAFDDRFAAVGSDGAAWRDQLDAHALRRRREDIAHARPRSRMPVVPSGTGDTTSCVAVDRYGNAVSFIHSLGLTFGARLMVPGTGVLLNNRLGRGAYLIDGHPNEVRPGRKPMHTLLAWMAAGPDGAPYLVGNTPGGDGQVQWNMQLLSHLLDHELDPQQAVQAPRFTVFPGSDAAVLSASPALVCESSLGADTLDDLRSRGYPVTAVAPLAAGGCAQLIKRDPATGALAGGSDPRQEGCALGV